MHTGIGSFSVGPVSLRTGLIIFLLAIVGFSAPVFYFIWYSFAGGREYEHFKRMENVLEWDVREEAQKAIDEGDYTLYTCGRQCDPEVPGIRWHDASYGAICGFQWMGRFRESDYTPRQMKTIRRATRKLALYNLLVYAEGEKHVIEVKRERARQLAGR